MNFEIFGEILSDNLNMIWNLSEEEIDFLIQNPRSISKEEVARLDNLKVIIYSNDHNPPHFHVISKDKKIDAKFKIENCEMISGDLNAKDRKKIVSFYNSVKTKIILEKIWNKRNI